MKIINLGRCQGKTTRLLYASEWQNIPILCATDSQKQNLLYQAERLGLNIPEPIVVREIAANKFRGREETFKDMLVDEAPLVLQTLLNSLGMMGEVKGITLTSDELK